LEGPEYLAWLEEQPEVTYLMGANTYRLMSGFAAGETPEGTDEFSADEEASVGGLTGRRRGCSRPRSTTRSRGPTARSFATTPSTLVPRDRRVAPVRLSPVGHWIRHFNGRILGDDLVGMLNIDRGRLLFFAQFAGADIQDNDGWDGEAILQRLHLT
jgi:hypothetical protein